MKKVLFTLSLIALTISVTAQTQSDRIACPNQTKDTLFVITPMVKLFRTVWAESNVVELKPVIIQVDSIPMFLTRKEEEK